MLRLAGGDQRTRRSKLRLYVVLPAELEGFRLIVPLENKQPQHAGRTRRSPRLSALAQSGTRHRVPGLQPARRTGGSPRTPRTRSPAFAGKLQDAQGGIAR